LVLARWVRDTANSSRPAADSDFERAQTCHVISDHLASNARLIEKFLPVEFDWQPHEGGWRVTVEA